MTPRRPRRRRREMATPAPRPRSSASAHGMFGAARRRRHLRLRRPGPPRRLPGAGRAPVRRLVRRGRRRAGGAPWRTPACLDDADREGRRRPRRADPPRARASTCSRVAQALRDDPALRFEICTGRQRRPLPAATGPRAARRLPPAVDHPQPAGPRSRSPRPTSDPHIPSVVSVYPANDWHERETWDFFGIVFDGHPALTRILMPDDWPGHPQRKDYPLGGIPVEYKGAQIPPPDERRSYS